MIAIKETEKQFWDQTISAPVYYEQPDFRNSEKHTLDMIRYESSAIHGLYIFIRNSCLLNKHSIN